MPSGVASNAPPADPSASDAHGDTLRSGNSHQQGAADARESAQHGSSMQDTSKADRHQHSAGAAHGVLPKPANGMDPDGLWDSSAHSRPRVPPPSRAHCHARSTSGLSAGSVPSVDFEQTAQPVASSGFGDHVRLLRCCMPWTPDASVLHGLQHPQYARRNTLDAGPHAGVHAAADIVPQLSGSQP